MKCWLRMAGWFAATFLLTVGIAEAATMHGTVKNATTGKPGAGVEVILIQLQGGMQPVANTKTDVQGQFSFDNPGIGTQPMLIRASYKGVDFHQPLPPGQNTVSVDIYEPTEDPKTISVGSHIVIFQPNGASLTVGEEYAVQNKSNPPVAYFRADGNFQMALPEKADLKQVAAAGPSGMPVIQAPIDKGKSRYAIAYAFQPGNSDIRLSYELPYPNDSAAVKLPTSYGGGRLLVAAPPSVKLTGDGLQAVGQEQGMNIYERDAVVAGTLVTVNLSGTAPPPSAAGGTDSGDGSQANSGQAGAAIQVVPGRLDALKWPLVFVLAAGFGLAAFLLARKPIVVPATGAAAAVAAANPGAAGKTAKQAAAQQASARQTEAPASPDMASLDAAAGQSLDALKDLIFRLELRRQAGTISEAEYAQERARAEKLLRNLVRG